MSPIELPSLSLSRLLQTSLETHWCQAHPQSPLTRQLAVFVEELACELRGQQPLHPATFDLKGMAGLGLGPALEGVVADFNALRGCIFELAAAHQIPLVGPSLAIVNRVVDGAISSVMRDSLASAVHDFRSPLTAISLAASLLERLVHPEAESQIRELLDIVRSSVEKQARLFQRVLDGESYERTQQS